MPSRLGVKKFIYNRHGRVARVETMKESMCGAHAPFQHLRCRNLKMKRGSEHEPIRLSKAKPPSQERYIHVHSIDSQWSMSHVQTNEVAPPCPHACSTLCGFLSAALRTPGRGHLPHRGSWTTPRSRRSRVTGDQYAKVTDRSRSMYL